MLSSCSPPSMVAASPIFSLKEAASQYFMMLKNGNWYFVGQHRLHIQLYLVSSIWDLALRRQFESYVVTSTLRVSGSRMSCFKAGNLRAVVLLHDCVL